MANLNTDIRGSRVLITGAAGFIGANLTRALLRRGAEVQQREVRAQGAQQPGRAVHAGPAHGRIGQHGAGQGAIEG